jgi:cyclophilin family peptidyl-prolyl cis-trans isomerase
MPKSRKWREKQNRAAMRGQQISRSRPKQNMTKVVVALVAIVAIAVSAIYVINPSLLFGNPSSTTIDWSLYSGSKVRLTTSMGNITIQLRTDKPITTTNFLNLTTHGLYDNTIFHRVVAGFMIQGGGIQNATIPNIADEIGSNNHNYNSTIAMANTGNANSANSQFFINVADNKNLYGTFDKSFTVFGRVIDGMNVVMAISRVATDTNDRPTQDVTLIKAEALP